jgi:glycine betaine transporter
MASPQSRIVLAVSLPAVALFALWGLAMPSALQAVSLAATGAVLSRLGWLVLLLSTAALLLVGWLMLGRHRTAVLGQPGTKPDFSTASWISMLFAAGMGTGLMVWAVAEPVTHFLAPPGGALPPAAAARQALVITYFHWGFHAWAIYALCGLVIAWFSFRRGRPALISAPLEGLLRGRADRVLAILADSLGLVAISFGLAATLVMGVLTMTSGLRALGVAAEGPVTAFGLLALLGAAAIASALAGLERGIRTLSNINALLAIALMAVVLALGPTATLLEIWVDSMGAYLAALPELSFRLRPLEGAAQWTQDWTLTYLLWWLAWGPFVGLFIARISRGRSVGQFVAGVVIVPTLGSILWFAIMGGSGLLTVMEQGSGGALATAVREDPTGALMAFLLGLPGGAVMGVVSIVLLLLFVVAGIDSAIFVLASQSVGGAEHPPARVRIAWGLALVALAAAMLAVADVRTARAMAILGALPYPLILLLQSFALIASLRQPAPELGSRPSPP